MTKHTPEPWTVEERGPDGAHAIKSLAPVSTRHITSLHRFGRGNSDRIVACVNALAGIDDPEAFVAAAKRLIGNAAGLTMLTGDRNAAKTYIECVGAEAMNLHDTIR